MNETNCFTVSLQVKVSKWLWKTHLPSIQLGERNISIFLGKILLMLSNLTADICHFHAWLQPEASDHSDNGVINQLILDFATVGALINRKYVVQDWEGLFFNWYYYSVCWYNVACHSILDCPVPGSILLKYCIVWQVCGWVIMKYLFIVVSLEQARSQKFQREAHQRRWVSSMAAKEDCNEVNVSWWGKQNLAWCIPLNLFPTYPVWVK